MAGWYRGIAVGGSGSSSSDVHDLGPGVYFADTPEVAGSYAQFRSEEFNERTGRLTPGAVLYGDFNEAEFGRTLDLTTGENAQAWNEFMAEPAITGGPNIPGGLRRDVVRAKPSAYGEYFRTFLTRQNININEYSAYIGPEYIRGGKQLCIRNQTVADRLLPRLVGRSIHAPAPVIEPPEVVTVTPGRGSANAAAMLGIFQAIGVFTAYLNDKVQGERAQAALNNMAVQVNAWQYQTPTDGALISVSYGRRDFNDPTGVMKKSSFIQGGDEFLDIQVDYGPTYDQALAHKKQIGSIWKELPESSPYKMEYRTSLYWIKPRGGQAAGSTALKSPVGWWKVTVKPAFLWYYQFRGDNTVTWFDPFNGKTGDGRWSLSASFLTITWATGSSEKWTLPLTASGQAGQCLWSNGLQDVRAEFGSPPDAVAKAAQNSPIGTWNVAAGPYRYKYKFEPGKVTWTDIFNGDHGSGSWSNGGERLTITWSSGSQDFWTMPLDPAGTKGTAQVKGEGSYNLTATKA